MGAIGWIEGGIHSGWRIKPYSKLPLPPYKHIDVLVRYSGKRTLLSFYCTVLLIVGIFVALSWRDGNVSRKSIKWNYFLYCYIKHTMMMIISARMLLMKIIRQKDSNLKCHGFGIGL